MEDRLERLENLVTLQDRTIEKLSDTIYEQQKQIDDLHRIMERIAGKLRELGDTMDGDSGPDAPPPHYGGR